METISLQVTKWQLDEMQKIKKKIGVPRAVLIRNAINLYLEKFEDRDSPLFDFATRYKKER